MMSSAPAPAVEPVVSPAQPASGRPGMIQRAAVLGAGTMGVRIAAHLANAGIPVVLLDLTGDSGKGVASAALDALGRAKPAALYDAANLRLIQPGTFEHDLGLLSKCDWVVEAVTENLAIKQELLAKITPFLKSGVILTTNTSGLPVARSSRNCPPSSAVTGSAPTSSTRRATCACSRSSPPRRPTRPTSPPSRTSATSAWARPSSTPATPPTSSPTASAPSHGQRHPPDAGAGPHHRRGRRPHRHALGWPRTGTFRLGDLVGVDVLAHVATNFALRPPASTTSARRHPRPFHHNHARTQVARRQGRPGLLQESGKEIRAATSATSSTGRPSTTSPSPAPNSPRSKWPRTSSPCPNACSLLCARPRKDKAAAFYWPSSPSSSPTPPTASPPRWPRPPPRRRSTRP